MDERDERRVRRKRNFDVATSFGFAFAVVVDIVDVIAEAFADVERGQLAIDAVDPSFRRIPSAVRTSNGGLVYHVDERNDGTMFSK